ncbi:hypothetical protein ORV05_19175 [Amycolatopsis cynarae]|uniref:Uncharacterized protein n=1 Tax=Amycolatopsis cynarae TaxID=2995223 RepID=A0ABY7ATC6_9PSEU|nr:hypothetical protein [Amycolatopsis sp. HUAS 11-8]WAL63156.1 hypothetical protein ORV05_19175 [Amycolatopsis sp. HUAS 11-8]
MSESPLKGLPEDTGERPVPRSGDSWEELLEHYRHTAVQTLARHLRGGTRCRACDQPWPCRAACAAEATLEL